MKIERVLSVLTGLSLLVHLGIHAQNVAVGTWEGTFMEQFRVIVEIDEGESDVMGGVIRMMASGQLLQDDGLTGITLREDSLFYLIPAKETKFAGLLDRSSMVLQGEFIFPDQSRHAIVLQKRQNGDPALMVANPENKFAASELGKDLDYIYAVLSENHPSLHAFTSEDSLQALLLSLKSGLKDSLNINGFYMLASRLTSAVRCSHTALRVPLHVQAATREHGNYIPVRLFFAEGKAYYISAVAGVEERVPAGAEILSIGGMSMGQIIGMLAPLIPSEGCNTTRVYNMLNREFYMLYKYIDSSESFTFTYRSTESEGSVTLSSSDYETSRNLYETSQFREVVDFRVNDDRSIALMAIPSFGIRDMDTYFRKLDSIMEVLVSEGTPAFILDLRDNEGGHPIFAAQLLSYLVEGEFTYFRGPQVPGDLDPLYHPMQANELQFTGELYVLINGGCLSTTGHLISLLKEYSDAIFAGEDPGSSYRCNDFSSQFTLPVSGLEMNVPKEIFETRVSGFEPCEPFPIDIGIRITAEDILRYEDPCLSALMSWLGSRNK